MAEGATALRGVCEAAALRRRLLRAESALSEALATIRALRLDRAAEARSANSDVLRLLALCRATAEEARARAVAAERAAARAAERARSACAMAVAWARPTPGARRGDAARASCLGRVRLDSRGFALPLLMAVVYMANGGRPFEANKGFQVALLRTF